MTRLIVRVESYALFLLKNAAWRDELAAAGGLAWCLIVPVHEARMRADSLAGRLLLLCCAILDAACPNLHQGCPNLHQVQPL